MFLLKLIIFTLPVLYVFGQSIHTIKPLRKDWIPWDRNVLLDHIIHMTRAIAKDATTKLRLADRYVAMHKGSINYELGFIAAGVYENFRSMIKIYRKYADQEALTKANYTCLQFHYAFGAVHGAYNEIRRERQVFYRLLLAHEKKKDLTSGLQQMFATTLGDVPFDVQRDISTQTLYNLDHNYTDYRKLSMRDIENITLETRRIINSRWIYKNFYTGQVDKHDNEIKYPNLNYLMLTVCIHLQFTYRSSMDDIRSYFELRQLYFNTLEFEVGYLVHQIIFQYETILELYHLVSTRFDYAPGEKWNTNLAPPPYMFFIYKTILTHCKEATHLINMLHELPNKYILPGQSIWDDYHTYSKTKGAGSQGNITSDMEKAISDYMRQKAKEKRQKLREARKNRKKYFANLDFLKTSWKWNPPSRTPPPNKNWPKDYGWEIDPRFMRIHS